MATYTVRDLAIQAKAAGDKNADDVALTVDAFVSGIDDASFARLVDEVTAALPSTPLVRAVAAEWARADADNRAEARAQSFA